MNDVVTVTAPAASLEALATALAEGEHDLGQDATAAGYALIQWPGPDVPWFVPRPFARGYLVADFVIEPHDAGPVCPRCARPLERSGARHVSYDRPTYTPLFGSDTVTARRLCR